MPSEMDQSLARHRDALVAPAGPFALGAIERFGVRLPLFENAPPSLAHYFAHWCAEYGERTFLVDGRIRLSFAETHAAARALAGSLIERHGVRPGDRVGLAARNSANWIVAFMAIVMAGGCATLLNGWWTAGELCEGIALAECELVLADPERAARLDAGDHAARVLVFVHDVPPDQGFAAAGGADAPLPALGPDDLATILFTSGSTDRAKGVASDHRAVVQAAHNFAAQSLTTLRHMTGRDEQPRDPPCALVGVPLFHVTGEASLFLQSFLLGRRLVLMPKWDPLEAMRLIAAEKVTYFVGVPLMSREIATHPQQGRFDLSSCRTFGAGGAPRPPAHVSLIREALPAAYPIIGYGLTETNAVGCGNFNENYLAKPGSTGPASKPLVELAILDQDGEPLPAGETGEVAIRSVCNFIGYWRDPEATRAAIRPDGFFLTGDLGYLDRDGYLFIVDRKKEIVIRGGENVSVSEVEQALYAHPGVAECAVFGLADARLDEVPAAVWVPRAGDGASKEDLRAFLAERLAPYKIPARFWRETGALPRLGSEKVDRRALRAKYSAISEAEQPSERSAS